MTRLFSLISLALVLPILIASSCLAQLPEIGFSKQIGTVEIDFVSGIGFDSTGNIFISGSSNGSLFGTNIGWADQFLAKYDFHGNEIWSRQYGSTGLDFAGGLAVASDGVSYVGGTYQQGDAFVRKYDADGSFQWERIYDSTRTDYTWDVSLTGDGGVYVLGETRGEIAGAFQGVGDAFVIKLDSDGGEVWSRQFGSSSRDVIKDSVVGADGSLYILGDTQGSVGGTFGGRIDFFLRKYDSSGNELWTTQIGDDQTEVAGGLTLNGNGGIAFTGLAGLTSGSFGAVIYNLDSDGNRVWSKEINPASNQYGYAIAADADGNLYIGGLTDRDLVTGEFSGPDNSIAFVSKFDKDGNEDWVWQMSGGDDDQVLSLAFDPFGNLYGVGSTEGDFFGISQGDRDGILFRFKPVVMLGDVNLDGTVNFLDITSFISVLSSGGFQAEADCDESGAVNFLDISPFIAILRGS